MSESKCREASLAMREGVHDKVYNIWTHEVEGGYAVFATWGRRGQTLQQGMKCRPTSPEEADKVFEKVLAEKLAKGYSRVEGSSGSLAASGLSNAVPPGKTKERQPHAADETGRPYLPQLLNPLTEGEAEALIRRCDADHWGCQEKKDGHHKLIIKAKDEITILNKQGKTSTCAAEIVEYAKTIIGDFVMDGEACGPDFFAFDLLSRNGTDYRELTYAHRYQQLKNVIGGPNGWPIHLLPIYTGDKNIRRIIEDLKSQNKEGFVLKDMLARHTAGLDHQAQFKMPWVAQCSAIVVQRNEQRSVALALYREDGAGICVGNVSIPSNQEIPSPGDVVEIRYKNWVPSGALYQPCYLGKRDDVLQSDCTFEKQRLRVKPGVDSE